MEADGASTTRNKDGDPVSSKPVADGAYTNADTDTDADTEKARATLKGDGLDTTGADVEPATVTLTS